MLRRSFLKSMTAAVVGSFVNLRPAIDRELIVSRFCDPEGSSNRYDLEKPFSVNGLVYGTDAKGMIRGEISNLDLNGQCIRQPPVLKVFEDYWHPSEFRPLDPDIQPTESWDMMICPECGDRRIDVSNRWTDPKILGRHDFDPDSGTIRDESCPLCHGKDYAGPNVTEAVPGIFIPSFRMKRILAIPGVKVCRSRSEHAILAVGEGFEIIQAGIHPEYH